MDKSFEDSYAEAQRNALAGARRSLLGSQSIYDHLDSAFKIARNTEALTFALEAQALRTRAGAAVDRDERKVKELEEVVAAMEEEEEE